MHLQTDVLVIGGGIAGLVAALASAKSGLKVTLVAKGAGTIAISCGCIDLLGQIEGQIIEDPWQAMDLLPPNHPYQLLGPKNVEKALTAFMDLLKRQNLSYAIKHVDNTPQNSLLPTIMGTLKPSYLVPEALNSEALFKARNVLICGVEDLRDLSPKLCRDQLRQAPALKAANLAATMLANPLSHAHRSVTALDLARYVNTPQGLEWLTNSLGRFAKAYDVILLPPILGTTKHAEIRAKLNQLLETEVLELLSIPPAVGGLRLREALLREAKQLGVKFLENIMISHAECRDGLCEQVKTTGESSLSLMAQSYVLATGGILGGGIKGNPSEFREEIFQLPVTPKALEDASQKEIRDNLCSMGVAVNHELRPVNAKGECLLSNVFVAGRLLTGYDFAKEKSGHGVSIATGWWAGTLAANFKDRSGGER